MHDKGGGSKGPTDFATEDEVREAINGLNEVNHLRLTKAASLYLGGSGYADEGELVAEALATPYMAACGHGGRRWSKDTEFMAYLMMTIRGLASDSRGSAVRRRNVSTRVPGGDGRDERDLLDTAEHATPSVEDTEVEVEGAEEQGFEDEAALAEVDALCSSDSDIGWIVKGIREGLTAREVQERSGLSKVQYETAHKRFRRKLEKLFPGRRKS